MKNIFMKINLFVLVLLLIVSCSKSFTISSVTTQTQCVDQNGYWYNNKCWKEFDDDGIAKSEIDSLVSAEMKLIEQSTFIIDNQTQPLVNFLPLEQDNEMLFFAVYGVRGNYKSLIFPTGKKQEEMSNGKFEADALHFNGNVISGNMDQDSKLEGKAIIDIKDMENLDVKITGHIGSKDGAIKKFEFGANEAVIGAGNSHLEVKGDVAFLSGTLGTITYHQVKEMIEKHVKVKTIVLTHISGSINDAVNLHTAMLLHNNNFTTKVLSDSDIASGGVDLFCAGINRIVEKGAKIGVHSWCCVNEFTARKIPKDHPAHMYQLDYFTKVLGNDNGPTFYFYTLEAASFDDIHYMSDDEIKNWKVATKFIDVK